MCFFLFVYKSSRQTWFYSPCVHTHPVSHTCKWARRIFIATHTRSRKFDLSHMLCLQYFIDTFNYFQLKLFVFERYDGSYRSEHATGIRIEFGHVPNLNEYNLFIVILFFVWFDRNGKKLWGARRMGWDRKKNYRRQRLAHKNENDSNKWVKNTRNKNKAQALFCIQLRFVCFWGSHLHILISFLICIEDLWAFSSI